MITITIEQGNRPKVAIDFRPSSVRHTALGLLALKAVDRLNDEIDELVNPAPQEGGTETPTEEVAAPAPEIPVVTTERSTESVEPAAPAEDAIPAPIDLPEGSPATPEPEQLQDSAAIDTATALSKEYMENVESADAPEAPAP